MGVVNQELFQAAETGHLASGVCKNGSLPFSFACRLNKQTSTLPLPANIYLRLIATAGLVCSTSHSRPQRGLQQREPW